LETIAIVGAQKDSGKTTFLNYFIEKNADKKIGISTLGFNRSVSLDNELVKKPEINVKPGMYVTSIPGFLNRGFVVIDKTDIKTVNGNIFIYKALDNHKVKIFGPPKSPDLVKIYNFFYNLDLDLFVIDGALNRKGNLNFDFVDKAFFSIGGSFDNSIDNLLKIADIFVKLFSIPQLHPMGIELKNSSIFNSDGSLMKEIDLPFLGNEDYYFELISEYNPEYLFIKTSLNDISFDKIIRKLKNKNLTLVLKNIFRINLSYENIKKLFYSQIKLNVLKKIDLAGLILNPFAPNGRHIDSFKLYSEFKNRFGDIPVFDIYRQEIL